MEGKLRNQALDDLKLLAVAFVVVLHVIGYTKELVGLESYSDFAKCVNCVMEAITYPAIHYFVLIGSYFMSGEFKPKNIIRTYSQTWIVSLLGLILVLIFLRNELTLTGIITSLLPFSQRAYWFVSDYIILSLLSPFLCVAIRNCAKRTFLTFLCVLFLLVCLLPYMSINTWYKGNLIVLILLFFVSQYIKKYGINIRRSLLLLLWMLFVLILSISGIISLMFLPGTASTGEAMYFYQYTSPFVVAESICLFGYFVLDTRPQKESGFISKGMVRSSLIVYLLHMHPILKNCYTKYEVLRFIDVKSELYPVYVLFLSTVILIVGFIISIFLIIPVSNKNTEIVSSVLSHLKHRIIPQKEQK